MMLIYFILLHCLTKLSLELNLNSHVVIIGGGVSGLAAYNQLKNSGFKNITLLEAADRLGGRIYTIPFNGSFIEIGAQWIHGTNGNPIYNLLKNEVDLSVEFYPENGVYYTATSDGKQINEAFSDYVTSGTDNFFETAYDQIESIDENSQRSLGSYLDPLYSNFLIQLSSKYKNYDRNLVDSLYESALQDQKSNYACSNFNEITAAGINENNDFGGIENANLKTGYFKLIDLLKANLSTSTIKLKAPVSSIDYSNTNGQIILNKNTPSQLRADLVLVTVSLGVLKQYYKTMFYPTLSAQKANAIEKLGFGTMNKIFFVFDKPIFRNGEQGLRPLWRKDLNLSLPYSDQKWNLYNNRFYRSFSSFDVTPKFKNILYSDLTGSDSIPAESLSDECFLDVINEIFKKFFPNLNLGRPTRVIRSKWSSNPLVKGSYSFIKVGSYPSDVKALASPIQNRIFFSGEATDSRYTGTVHGAYITGINTAKSIARLL